MTFSCTRDFLLESSTKKKSWAFKDMPMKVITIDEIFYIGGSPKLNGAFDGWANKPNIGLLANLKN